MSDQQQRTTRALDPTGGKSGLPSNATLSGSVDSNMANEAIEQDMLSAVALARSGQ